jgi:predicted  nucleic acid-binding Zn-ribbon protein
MNEQLKILLTLQHLEIHIHKTQEKLKVLAQQFNRLDEEFISLKEILEKKKDALNEMRKAYRSMESDVQTVQARLQKSEVSLRSVKTNREYQSMLKEIDDQKNKIWSMEDVMLEYLENIEKKEAELKAKTEECHSFELQAEKEKTRIALEREDVEKQLDSMLESRQEVSGKIPADLVQGYLLIKGRVGDVAVAAAKNAVCHGCHMNIPPQMYNELQQKDEIAYCPHCQRMIYWAKKEEIIIEEEFSVPKD